MTPTRVRKSAAERKAEIIDTALELAAEVGPDRLTTQALAGAVGISQPGIFRHFPSKDDLWEAIAHRIGELMQQNWATMNETELKPEQRLRAFVSGHLAFLQATPAIPAILFSRELHAENEKLRLFFAGMMERAHGLLSAMIVKQIEAKDVRAELNPDDAAYLVLALIQGLAMRWSLTGRKFDLGEEGRRLLELQISGFQLPAPGSSGD